MATITKTYKVALSGGFNVPTSGTRGYYAAGSTTASAASTVDFSDIPAGTKITKVTVTWGNFSASALSCGSISKYPPSDTVKTQLNNGDRSISFSVSAGVSWRAGYTDAPAGYKYFSWRLTETTIIVEYDDGGGGGGENVTVAYGKDGEWHICYVYYGVNGQWKQCQAWYGSAGEWKPTNHSR